MEYLNPSRPSFIGSVNLTTDGTPGAAVLRGAWLNFNELVKAIGRIQKAADGTEHLQLHTGVECPQIVSLSFDDVPGEVVQKLTETGNNHHVEVGIMRRYPIVGHEPDAFHEDGCFLLLLNRSKYGRDLWDSTLTLTLGLWTSNDSRSENK